MSILVTPALTVSMKLTHPSSRIGRTNKPSWLLATALWSAALAALLLDPVVAGASCAGGASVQEAIRSAPTVFVGTVTGLSGGDRVATVRVDDVWRGHAIPSSVDVVGTPDLNAAATSADRTYVAGSQDLFVPDGGGPQGFTDNNCTATQLYTAGLAALRPANAPGAPTQSASAFPLALALIVPLVMLVGAAAVLMRRGRQGSRSR